MSGPPTAPAPPPSTLRLCSRPLQRGPPSLPGLWHQGPQPGRSPGQGLGPERAVPDLDVFLQDWAVAEGALFLCAIPKGESGWVGAGAQPKDQGSRLEQRGGLNRQSTQTYEAGGKVVLGTRVGGTLRDREEDRGTGVKVTCKGKLA